MKFNYDMRGGEFLRRSKRRQHLPKIRTFQKFGQFFLDRQTDRRCGSQGSYTSNRTYYLHYFNLPGPQKPGRNRFTKNLAE